MDSRGMPIIRLNIDSMKHQIAHMLGIEGSELEKVINEQIERQLEVLVRQEIPDLVRATIIECVNNDVKYYFSYGEGSKAIQETIQKNFKITNSE